MEPYVIRQGDYLTKLAHKFGFDADTVWNDDKNAKLRQDRSNPEILCATDLLYIPDSKTEYMQLTTGATNSFVSEVPTVSATIRFSDPSLASASYSIEELPELTGLVTEADGTAQFEIPVTLDVFTIVFSDPETEFEFGVGHLDPINTLTGIAQRLQNLGHMNLEAPDPCDVESIRAALRELKASSENGGADSDDASSSQDDAGLSDDGVLDDATSHLLAGAHGC